MPSESTHHWVNGPFKKQVYDDGYTILWDGWVSIYDRDRNWSRQRKPYTSTLPYSDRLFHQTNSEQYIRRLDWPQYNILGYPGGSNHRLAWVDFCRSRTDSSNLLEDAKLKVLEQVSDASWSVPVWAGELEETTQMIADTARKLAKAGSQLRKKQFKKCADTLGLSMRSLHGPKDNWMSYRYGWIPAIGDCCDAAETFARTVNEQKDVIRLFGSSSSNKGFVDHDTFYFDEDPRRTYSTAGTVTGRGAAWLLLERKYPLLAQLNDFGLVNWPSNAYNLVPLSWVVDWAYPLGRYLEAQTALLGYQVLDGGTSLLHAIKGTTVTTSLPWYESGRGPTGTFLGRDFTRQTWNGQVSLFPPAPNLSMNWKRCFDAAALLHNVFGPILKR